MGYRSQVAYVVAFTNKTTLNEFIAKVMVLGGDEVNALKECQIEVVEGSPFTCYRINYFADDVKWYDSHPEVQGHTQLYRHAIEWYSNEAGYRFLRIGEEQGDVEDEMEDPSDNFDLYDEFYTYTRMSLPFSEGYEPVGDALAVIP